jgi:hypothetical protein
MPTKYAPHKRVPIIREVTFIKVDFNRKTKNKSGYGKENMEKTLTSHFPPLLSRHSIYKSALFKGQQSGSFPELVFRE